MRVDGHPVSQACTATTRDTSIYYYMTDNGHFFAAGRVITLPRLHTHLASDLTEAGLRSTYGAPEGCVPNLWRYRFGVQRVLQWRRGSYTVTFQTTAGNRTEGDRAPPEDEAVVDIQIARGVRGCSDLLSPPSRE
jgi:hypothetical protein